MIFQHDTPTNRLLNLAIASGAAGKLVEETVTGNPVAFETDIAKPLKGLVIPFTLIQAGSGDPSPDNVRPISGITGLTIYKTGVNVCTGGWVDGSISLDGEDAGDTDLMRSAYFPVKGGAAYHIVSGDTYKRVYWYDENKTFISNNTTSAADKGAPDNAAFARVSIVKATTNPADYSFNFPKTDTDQHAYTGETIPVVFPAQGKNLLNPHMFDDRPSYYTAESNGTITVKSTDYSPWANIEFSEMKAGTYTISYTADSGEASLRTENNYDEVYHVTPGNPVTFTVTEGEGIKMKVGIDASAYPLTASVQIEAGSSATAFEPFTNTVYGGALDALTGVLTVGWKTVDMGSLTFYKSSATSSVGGSVFAVAIGSVGDGLFARERNEQNPVMSDVFKTATDSTWYVNNLNNNEMFSDKTSLFIAASEYDTKEEFTEAVSGHVLAYKLATPQTVQLDPVTLATLTGANTIWTDTNGTNEITYMKKG